MTDIAIRPLIARDVRHRFAQLAAETVAPRADANYHAGTLDLTSWQRFADEGLWRLVIPTRLGGDGGTWRDFAAAVEGIAVGGRDLGFCLSLIAHAGLLRAVLTYGSPHQQQWLVPILADGAVGATALTEPQGGSDVARTRTAAHPHPAIPGAYRLSGQKDHVTHGPIADVALILGRIPELGKRDITLFLADLRGPDVRRGEIEDMAGNRTSPTGPFEITGMTVDDGHILGTPGDGLRLIYDIISLDRLLYGVVSAAYAESVLSDVMAYADEREAFGHVISDYQYIQQRLTDLRAGIDITRSISYTALEALLRADPEANRLCSVAKMQGAEFLKSACEHELRIKAHIGYLAQGKTMRRYADAVGTVIAGGTIEMQRKNIFNQMRKTGAVTA